MAKVMWVGEDALHTVVTHDGRTIENAGPSFTTWRGLKFVKGEAVNVTDPAIIAKAKNNPFFAVEDEPAKGKA